MLIGEVIKDNHFLFGIHMEGNECEVDCDGFIVPPNFVKRSALEKKLSAETKQSLDDKHKREMFDFMNPKFIKTSNYLQ